MSTPIYLKIPKSRLGVLIGSRGKVKKEIENLTQTKIEVDSESGVITITPKPDALDPVSHLKAREIIRAIGRGFNPKRASRLIEDNTILEVIDIREFANTPNSIRRLKGRVIGEEGKSWKLIEEVTGAYISVYGHTVAIIGTIEEVELAKRAVIMLLEGANHGTVYKFLFRQKRLLKRSMFKDWKPSI